MNITFEPKDTKIVDLDKPTLMRNIKSGFLVLSTGKNTNDGGVRRFEGIVVVGANTYEFGSYAKYWEADCFTEHKGVLTIDNTGDHESNI